MGGKRVDLIGRRYGLYKVIGKSRDSLGYFKWQCRCDCGVTKLVSANMLTSGKSIGCGCPSTKELRSKATKPKKPKYMDLTSRTFGNLHPIKVVGRVHNGTALWLCQCECGNTAEISSSELLKSPGGRISCGCMGHGRKREPRDLWAEKFTSGSWTVTGPYFLHAKTDGKPVRMWPCVCECGTGDGNPVYISAWDLIRGKSKSCGCMSSSTNKLASRGRSKSSRTIDQLIPYVKKQRTMRKLGPTLCGDRPVKRKKTSGICSICGKPLSSYNYTGQCFSHSVEDPYQNKPWEPAYTRLAADERIMFSETPMLTTGASRGNSA